MRHLLSAADLSFAEATSILDVAVEMQQVQSRPVKKLPALRGRTVVNIFFEDSTRTRTSFEIAGKWLSADTINVSAKGSSVSKGESLRDTMMTLDAMGVDAFVIRHSSSGAAAQVASWVKAQVINAGDGQHEHPTQALLDAYAMRQHFRRLATVPEPQAPIPEPDEGSTTPEPGEGSTTPGSRTTIPEPDEGSTTPRSRTTIPEPPATIPEPDEGSQATDKNDFTGKKIAIVGDLLHSRVVRSNVLLQRTLGGQVTLVAPPTLLPTGVETWGCPVTGDFDAALADADIVMMLRVQRERMAGGFFPTEREYAESYGLTEARLAALKPGAAICHPGPMNRGVEISSAAADAANSLVLEQVAAGVAVRMSVLYHLLGSDEGALK